MEFTFLPLQPNISMHSLLLFSIHFQMRWQREFVQQPRGSSVDYRFIYSPDLNVPFMGDIEKEKLDAGHS